MSLTSMPGDRARSSTQNVSVDRPCKWTRFFLAQSMIWEQISSKESSSSIAKRTIQCPRLEILGMKDLLKS